jgi:hypothetical protein
LSGADLVEGRLNVIDSKASVFVGNNNRHAVASIYTAVGPFIKLDVLEQSRSADEKGTVYLWKDEARVLGKWLVANTRPTLKQRLGALMKRHNDKTQP